MSWDYRGSSSRLEVKGLVAVELLTIGQVSARAGIAPSALRYYEQQGLVAATRTAGGARRYPRTVLRRLAFVRAAQNVGLSLTEIREALATLPDGRPPTARDWARLSRGWRGRLGEEVAAPRQLRGGPRPRTRGGGPSLGQGG